MSSRKQRFRPVLVWAGFILAMATSVALMWFALWAPGLEWPRVPDRQDPGENYGFSLARGVGCDAITINSLSVSDRKRRVDECAQHEGQLRLDQENLNQAVRTTNAAEEAIRVSYQQTRIAYVQSAVTVLALLFTGVAAWAAAGAARTANRALSHAEAASRDELRAYVHIDRTELRWGSPGGGAPSITLFAKNTGQTPAKWFGAQTTVVLGPIEGDNALPLADLHQTDRKLHKWSALGGGTELSFSGTSVYIAELQKAHTEQLTINVLESDLKLSRVISCSCDTACEELD